MLVIDFYFIWWLLDPDTLPTHYRQPANSVNQTVPVFEFTYFLTCIFTLMGLFDCQQKGSFSIAL